MRKRLHLLIQAMSRPLTSFRTGQKSIIASPFFLLLFMFTQRRSFRAWRVCSPPARSLPDHDACSPVPVLFSSIESTPLSCSLADQGIKIRIRKDIRQRKPRGSGPPFPTMPLPHPLPQPEPIPDDEDVEQDSEPEEDKGRKRSSATVERDERDREPKRARVDPDSSGEWSIDPTLAPAPQVSASASAPPTSAVSTGSSGYDHHRPTLQAIPPPPHPPTAASHHYAPHHAYEPPPPPRSRCSHRSKSRHRRLASSAALYLTYEAWLLGS